MPRPQTAEPRDPPGTEFVPPDACAQRFVVSPTQAGQRLDRVLASLTAATRSHVKLLIDGERVRVGGQYKKAGYLVRAQDEIEVLPLPRLSATAVPEEIPLEVLYEDEYLAAINKPAGIVVHPAPGQWRGTIVNALLFHWQRAASADFRPGIVHRLDKDTSGVLLVAKDPWTLEQLAGQFKERQVRKTYVAVVFGTFTAPVGDIALPIGRHPVDRKKMSVSARRSRAAMSRYQVVAESSGLSLVRLYPETGRTHQLRVHLAAIGHPIVGDRVYGGHRRLHNDWAQIVGAFPRQALHAESLRFCHPFSGTPMTIAAPYPQDFSRLLTTLRFYEAR